MHSECVKRVARPENCAEGEIDAMEAMEAREAWTDWWAIMVIASSNRARRLCEFAKSVPDVNLLSSDGRAGMAKGCVMWRTIAGIVRKVSKGGGLYGVRAASVVALPGMAKP